LVLWAVKRLPEERWQFLASVPVIKDSSGHWRGINFTYYGLLTANALVFGVALLIVLFGALGIATPVTLALILVLLLICLPSARWIAQLVEGKTCTFTVAGAFFVGIFATPAVIYFFNWISIRADLPAIPVIPALAAFGIAYALGEGLGRLACISFGCCYGVALVDSHPLLKRLFDHWYFVFSGKMKKISYASDMEGTQVVPVQAVTAVVYLTTGLLSTLFFLQAGYALAFICTMVVTQAWRFFSEMMRADYRGDGKVSAYQIMGIVAISFAVAMSYLEADDAVLVPDLFAGIEAVWQPLILLILQVLWGSVFVLFGKSMVTSAEIHFHLHEDRI
jgi:hypothetical protein